MLSRSSAVVFRERIRLPHPCAFRCNGPKRMQFIRFVYIHTRAACIDRPWELALTAAVLPLYRSKVLHHASSLLPPPFYSCRDVSSDGAGGRGGTARFQLGRVARCREISSRILFVRSWPLGDRGNSEATTRRRMREPHGLGLLVLLRGPSFRLPPAERLRSQRWGA